MVNIPVSRMETLAAMYRSNGDSERVISSKVLETWDEKRSWNLDKRGLKILRIKKRTIGWKTKPRFMHFIALGSGL